MTIDSKTNNNQSTSNQSDANKVDALAKLRADAIEYHSSFPHGKVFIQTKACAIDQLKYAYTPGVGQVCLAIQENPSLARHITMKGNNVVVITNGTAILGLGDIGALSGKPVMEGKALLMNKLAGIDATDLCIQEKDINKLADIVTACSDSFGCINLEDIAAPGCFDLLETLKNRLDMPVFHDDQEGTACAVTAALTNALKIAGKSIENIKIVCSGAGAAMLATVALLREFGLKRENVIMFDSKGCIHSGRTDLSEQKKQYAFDKKYENFAQALNGADVFLGLSTAGVLQASDIVEMNEKPILFAMANPTPEILPDTIKSVRSDAIIATGRSDFPNQVNNSVCFPYLFRATLDLNAKKITLKMLRAFVDGLVSLAQSEKDFGPGKILPSTMDQRIIYAVVHKIMSAAVEEGVAQDPDYRAMHMYMYKTTLWNQINKLPAKSKVVVSGDHTNWLEPYTGVFSKDDSSQKWEVEYVKEIPANQDMLYIYRNGLDIFTTGEGDLGDFNIPNYNIDNSVCSQICELVGAVDIKNHKAFVSQELKKVMFMVALLSKIS